MVLTAEEQRELPFRITSIFSPSAPINKLDLFAGRAEQLIRIAKAVNTRGQHVVMFGERGVGKTSLATILKEMLPKLGAYGIKVNCVEGDDFQSLWERALREVAVSDTRTLIGFAREERTEYRSLVEYAGNVIGSASIRPLVQPTAESAPLTFIFDEFDRLPAAARVPFADTIKDLADNIVNVTLVLVGVAKTVEELIAEHASISRSLVEVKMPRMTSDELREIVDKAMENLGMTIAPDARDLIVFLSKGLPHYTHLLGQESAIAAIGGASRNIDKKFLSQGITSAINNSQQSVTSAYQKAITSQKKSSLFAQVLLACAITKVDEFGYFVSADVRESLNQITGEEYDIPNFSQHLDKFSGDDTRGPVLEKSGTSRRFRFKFRNPLLQPYVIMKGLHDRLITGDFLTALMKTMPEDRTLGLDSPSFFS